MKRRINKAILYLSAFIFLSSLILLMAIQLSDGGEMDIYKKETKQLDGRVEEVIDWDKLKKTNSDVQAWIKVPGTVIDYPVLSPRKKEVDYYLHRDIHKKYSFAGSIYSRQQEGKAFYDPVTVVYGHNMRNGSMFGELKKFEKKNFFDKHSIIEIYLPEKKLVYQIVSSYRTDNKDILSRTKKLEEYQDEILNPSNGYARKDVPEVKNRILTLSTCSNTESERRVLQAILTDEIVMEK